MDLYDLAAARLPSETRAAIAAFWKAFAAQADALDHHFSTPSGQTEADPVAVMRALAEVSDDLMWEFGPSARGHALCVTAEWRDELRPLARAVRAAAPDLPRWHLIDAREPSQPDRLFADFEARARREVTISSITPRLGPERRVDLTVQGTGDEAALRDQATILVSMLMGEDTERDWLGYIDVEPASSPGLLGRLRKTAPERFDPANVRDAFEAEIAAARSTMPDLPYAALPFDAREVSLFKVKEPKPNHPRPDLIVFSGPDETYARAVMSRARFSSRCHSRHGEWFFYLRIPRTPETPFDQVADRHAVEEEVQTLLSEGGLGGCVAGSHGEDAVYVDAAATDVGAALARLERGLADRPFAGETSVHFLDAGLTGFVLPLATTARTLN